MQELRSEGGIQMPLVEVFHKGFFSFCDQSSSSLSVA
jgi:hypothetical protein